MFFQLKDNTFINLNHIVHIDMEDDDNFAASIYFINGYHIIVTSEDYQNLLRFMEKHNL